MSCCPHRRPPRNVYELFILNLCFHWKKYIINFWGTAGHLFTSQRKSLFVLNFPWRWFQVLQSSTELRDNVEGQNQHSILAKVRDRNQRDKRVGRSVYCTCGKVWEEGQEELPHPTACSAPQSLTPLFTHILQQAPALGLRPAPTTAAVLAHWEFTSVFNRLCRDGQGLPHLPAAQDSTQKPKHATLRMLSDAVTETICLP